MRWVQQSQYMLRVPRVEQSQQMLQVQRTRQVRRMRVELSGGESEWSVGVAAGISTTHSAASQ